MVVVERMKVPKSCSECPCLNISERLMRCSVDGRYFGSEDVNWMMKTRPNWCPLLEVGFPEYCPHCGKRIT